MRWKLCWVLAALFVVAGCGGDENEPKQPTRTRAEAGRDSVPRKPVYPEPQAAQILRAINESEIASARVARERTQNNDVMRFAMVMMSDHRAMTQLLDSLLPPVPDSTNPESKRISEAAQQVVDSLWRIEGGFNNTYIERQVRDHESALLLLDTAIIPSATNAALKKLLRDLRPAMVAHLQRAKQIYVARMAMASNTSPSTARPSSGEPTPSTPRPRPTSPMRPSMGPDTALIGVPVTTTSNM